MTLNFTSNTIDERDPQVTLLRVEINRDNRALETITTDLVGQNTYKNHEVATQEWDAAHGLYRFTVEQTLDPGEYALVETTPEGHNLFVWDFGVGEVPDGNSRRNSQAIGTARLYLFLIYSKAPQNPLAQSARRCRAP